MSARARAWIAARPARRPGTSTNCCPDAEAEEHAGSGIAPLLKRVAGVVVRASVIGKSNPGPGIRHRTGQRGAVALLGVVAVDPVELAEIIAEKLIDVEVIMASLESIVLNSLALYIER